MNGKSASLIALTLIVTWVGESVEKNRVALIHQEVEISSLCVQRIARSHAGVYPETP